MKFERTDSYMAKLFEFAMMDEKRVVQDAKIVICAHGHKLKAYCEDTKTYLQFPTRLRGYSGQRYIADVVEVIRTDNVDKYYRTMKGSIRTTVNSEVLA